MPLDYPTLKIIWWLFIGVLLIGFAIMDGHDMGVGSLLPVIGRSDEERRVLLNTIGPHWEGNQVWLVTGAGALFAAWPLVYAAAFSGFYWAMMAALWALFLRPVGFHYRSKLADARWRSAWDWGLVIGSAVPPLLFGVAFGNLLQGVPFHFDADLRAHYSGGLGGLLNPFALLAGALALAMMCLHGATFLAHRCTEVLQQRARHAAVVSGLLTLALFTLAGLWLWLGNFGYAITSTIDPAALANPLAKTVEARPGAWFDNYRAQPASLLLPVTAYVATALAMLLVARRRTLAAFVASAFTQAAIIGTAGAAMFPFLMPSSTAPGSSLTAWDAVASHRSLGVMFWVTILLLPLVCMYTAWAYRVMRGKVTAAYVRENEHSLY